MVIATPTYHDQVRRDVFDLMPQNAGRVLDVGGGVGGTSAALKAEGRASHVVLMDQVNSPLPEIDAVYSGNLEDPQFIKDVIEKEGPFDTVLCLDVLEHLRDPWAVVRALHDGLAIGGCIVASIPNVNYFGLVAPLVLKGRYELQDAGILDRTHIRWFVKDTAISLMTGSGLELEKITDNIIGPKKRLAQALSFGMLNRFLALQYHIRVRRTR